MFQVSKTLMFSSLLIYNICNTLIYFSLGNNFSTVSANVLWYFTLVFLMTRSFSGYLMILTLILDLGVWPSFWKLTLFITFQQATYCTETFLWQDLSTAIKKYVLLIYFSLEMAINGGICVWQTHLVVTCIRIQIQIKC